MKSIALLVLCLATCGAWGAPAVMTDSGEVRGERDDGVDLYRGIPYAAPPVGTLRWAPPAAPAPWSEPLAATAFGPACSQPERPDRQRDFGPQSEDCLTLNVWTPVKADKAPVMVWIHGGAFRVGKSGVPVYDGKRFAEQGVILVSINYRLGYLGFFAHPRLSAQAGDQPLGNYALMDQLAALRWVQRNIARFGGDPGRVTIFGESAGGSSVLFLLTVAEAKGLFHQAIAQSGGGLQRPRFLKQDLPGMPSLETVGQQIVRQAGLADADDPIAALRALPAEEFIRKINSFEQQGIGFGPVIDGRLVTQPIALAYLRGDVLPVPLIIGANSHEASVLQAFGQSAADFLPQLGEAGERLMAVYSGEAGSDRAYAADLLFGDASFVAPARAVARSQSTRAPTFVYHLDYVRERARDEQRGTNHGGDILLVFDSLDSIPFSRVLFTREDRAVAKDVNRYWVNFARTGNPNGAGLTEWPRYDTTSDELLLISNEGMRAAAHYRAAQLDMVMQVLAGRQPAR